MAERWTREPSAFQKLAAVLGRNVTFVLNVQASQRASAKRAMEIAQREKLEREAEALRQAEAAKQSQAMKLTESVKPTAQSCHSDEDASFYDLLFGGCA
jgi:hypothetical protein